MKAVEEGCRFVLNFDDHSAPVAVCSTFIAALLKAQEGGVQDVGSWAEGNGEDCYGLVESTRGEVGGSSLAVEKTGEGVWEVTLPGIVGGGPADQVEMEGVVVS